MAPVRIRRTFEVPGCSISNGLIHSTPFVRVSAVFSGAGYDWTIHHYPYVDGHGLGVLYLRLETEATRVAASLDVALLDPTGSLPVLALKAPPPPAELDSSDENARWTPGVEMHAGHLEAAPGPGYLERHCLLFECTITVFFADDGAAAPAAIPSRAKQPPPSDMMEKLAGIHATGDGADVTYSVEGRLFRAHRIILAMRSPVFKAELYGGMMESTAALVEVGGVRAAVFEALLRYMYTDALPAGDGHDDVETMCDLLAAADRYDVERLRLLCAHRLCAMLTAGNVARMLSLADDHRCDALKDACIRFMTTPGRMKDVAASEGYMQLRSTRPLILVQAFEKSNGFANV
ncbi:hypothetical protein ACP4OV_026984 [Aristida adscensionis]